MLILNLEGLQNSIAGAGDLNNSEAAEQYSQAALDYYRQAAETAKLPGNPPSLTAIQAQLNQLSLSIETEKWSDAENLWPQIQVEIGNLPPSRASVYAQVNLAQSLTRFKQKKTEAPFSWQDIVTILDSAVQDARKIGDKRAESYALGNLGKLQYESQWPPSNPQSLLERALYLAQTENAPEIAYRWQWQLGRIYKQRKDTQQAIAAYQAAWETLEILRGDLIALNQEIQFSFREQVEPVYRELVSLLLQPQGEVSQDNLKQARDIIEALQLAELNNFFQEACVEAQPQQIDQIDPHAAVIYSIILPERLALILSLPKQPLHYYAISAEEQEVERVFDDLWATLTPFVSTPEPLRPKQQLYDWLIRPAEAELKRSDIKTLVFVMDGVLRSVPVAALHDGQKYLIEKYNLALTPGLQLLGSRSLASESLRTLAVGLAEARQEFSALPGIEREIKEITQIVPGEILLNQEFTRSSLKTQIETESFPLVHLATHGLFSSQAENTFLLAWDGPINVKELDQLLQGGDRPERSPIELLILSACQTAAGDKRAALGLAGVAVRSGARSTIATLWSVQDQSTAELMIQFYRTLNQSGVNKAETLRQAQLFLLRSSPYQHPYYWAPFVLVGNWL